MNDYSYLLYSEKSPLATYCYDLIPLTYEERGMLPAKKPAENGFIEETRFLNI
ncbi:hypothetical protein MiAbB_03968 [Microcystis aeruginosa NIES-4285]|jgi:hypothetical protein|uniref:Uncharacterized protein n=1 Tax=Microcystis aeruginosa NIES-4285 TaxID=2497681 RepID=A0A402DIJ4_MICAE|nr:hypothetical protein MiAbB_03968 [Microcystis aeruginosa NIES-4285]